MPGLFSYPTPFHFGRKNKAERQEPTRKMHRSHSGESSSSSSRPKIRVAGSDDDIISKTKGPRVLRGVKKLTTSSPVKKVTGMVSPRWHRRTNKKAPMVGSNKNYLTSSERDVLDGFLVTSQTIEISDNERKTILQALDEEIGDYYEEIWENCEDESSEFY
jgi:hypothetical protein